MHPSTSSHSPELRGIILTCVTAAALYMIAAAPARVLRSPEPAVATEHAEQAFANHASLPYYYFPSQFAAPIGPVFDEPVPTF